MAKMADVLRILADHGPSLSGDVADRLWPGKRFNMTAHGGPTGGQRAAAGLLGRLAQKGLVQRTHILEGMRSVPTVWWLTPEGLKAAAAKEPEHD